MKRSVGFLLVILSAGIFAQQLVPQLDCPGAVIVQAGQSGTTSAKCAPVQTPTPTPTPLVGLIVSPAGKPTAAGTLADPRDFASAIAASSPAKSGTIYLRGGTYTGPFTSSLAGAVTIRAYSGERPVLVCGSDQSKAILAVNGSSTIWRDFEVTCPTADRSKPIGAGVDVFAPGAKLINLVVHDNGVGIGLWTPAIDSQVYGCLIYHNGYQGADPDRGHGHGIYTQNDVGTKRIVDNVIFDQYGWGFHAYTEGGAIKGFWVEGNTLFANGSASREGTHANILVGGMRPAERVTITGNFTYHAAASANNVQLPYGSAANLDLTLTDNYFGGGVVGLGQNWASVAARGNTVTGQLQMPLPVPSGWAIRDTVTTKADKVFVRLNRYDEGRANVTVFNWNRAASVSVDLSSALQAGDKFEIFEVHDLAKPVVTGQWSGVAIALPVAGEFGAYLVRKAN